MKVLVTQAAERDLEEATDFYDEQEPGAGDYFMRKIVEEIDELAQTAGIHPQKWGYHKVVTRRFPLLIFYLIRDGAVHVRAVLDGRCHPARNRRTVAQRRQQEQTP